FQSIAAREIHRPHVIVELMDPENARLFGGHHEEVIVSPVVLSHVLAHVALRRDLHAVYEEIFGPGGAEVGFRRADEFGVTGESVPFARLQEAAAACGEIALGVHAEGSAGVVLNPNPQERFQMNPHDEIAVLTTYERSPAAAAPVSSASARE